MSNNNDIVTLDGGKYSVQLHKDGEIIALRHGEKWRDCTGDNLIYYLTESIIKLIAENQKLNDELQQVCDTYS